MQSKCVFRWLGSGWLRSASSLLISVALSPTAVQSPQDNGILVGEPKIHDSRALTLMLDDLEQSLHKTNFVNTKALASAPGNLGGSNKADSSQAKNMAERVGFEPTVEFPRHTLSKRAP